MTNDALKEMDWIAQYVTSIASLPCKRGHRIEIVASSEKENDTGNEAIIIARSGKTHLEALRKCVRAGIPQFTRVVLLKSPIVNPKS